MEQGERTEQEVVLQSVVVNGAYGLTDQVIYRGLASTIFLAADRKTSLQVGVKVLMKRNFDSDEERRNAVAEMQIHSALPPHPNVIQLLASEETPDAMLLVTPYTPHGDLWDLTRYGQTYCEAEVRNCIAQMLAALHHVHEAGIIHGDVKPQNFLLFRTQKRYCVQLCDFGLAERPSAASGLVSFHGVRGTSGWFAPEMLAHRDYGFGLDLFSCGLIMFRMLGGYPAFDPPSNFTEAVDFDERCWCHIGPLCRQLISQLLCLKPEGRGTAADLSGHQWVAGPPPEAPSEAQIKALSEFGPPPTTDVKFWPVGEVPNPHLCNSYASLAALAGDDAGSPMDEG